MTETHDAVIIGAGLFGCIVAKALRSQEKKVFLLDAEMPNSGSKPSGCLMKPGWFAGLGRSISDPSLKLLDSLYGVQTRQFTIRPTRMLSSVLWIPREKILAEPHEVGTATTIKCTPGISGGTVEMGNHGPGGTKVYRQHYAPLVVVAAGIWTSKFFPVEGLVGKAGAAIGFDRAGFGDFILPWAPYKQIVGFSESETKYWLSDGTAILVENWTEERLKQSLARCTNQLPGVAKNLRPTVTMGIRPFVKGAKPCALAQMKRGVWVLTGGAKNGTIAAGWAASQLMVAT